MHLIMKALNFGAALIYACVYWSFGFCALRYFDKEIPMSSEDLVRWGFFLLFPAAIISAVDKFVTVIAPREHEGYFQENILTMITDTVAMIIPNFLRATLWAFPLMMLNLAMTFWFNTPILQGFCNSFGFPF